MARGFNKTSYSASETSAVSQDVASPYKEIERFKALAVKNSLGGIKQWEVDVAKQAESIVERAKNGDFGGFYENLEARNKDDDSVNRFDSQTSKILAYRALKDLGIKPSNEQKFNLDKFAKENIDAKIETMFVVDKDGIPIIGGSGNSYSVEMGWDYKVAQTFGWSDFAPDEFVGSTQIHNHPHGGKHYSESTQSYIKSDENGRAWGGGPSAGDVAMIRALHAKESIITGNTGTFIIKNNGKRLTYKEAKRFGEQFQSVLDMNKTMSDYPTRDYEKAAFEANPKKSKQLIERGVVVFKKFLNDNDMDLEFIPSEEFKKA